MIITVSERKMDEMKDAILGKALLNEIRERNPEVAQIMSNYFYYETCNSLMSLLSDNTNLNEREEEAIEEVIMATRNFMKEYIEIFEKYVFND
jgi:hypothetical protein